jgi:hypothetical protein
MKEKKNTIIALSIIAFLLQMVFVMPKIMDRSVDLPKLKKIDQPTDEIIIKTKDETIRIYKKDSAWVINDDAYPADEAVINRLDSTIRDLVISDLTSDKPYYDRYELTPETGISVVLNGNGSELRGLVIGRKSEQTNHSFIRLNGRPEVFKASGNLKNEFSKPVDELRNRNIFNLAKGDIGYFEINYKGRKSTLVKKIEAPAPASDDAAKPGQEKKTDTWSCAEKGGLRLDEKKIDSYLDNFTSVSQVRAKSFPYIDKKSLKNAVCTIILRVSDLKAGSSQYTLSIYKSEKADEFVCAYSESDYVFTVVKSNGEKFFKTPDDFTDKDKKK